MNRETMLQIAKEHRAIIHDMSYTLAVKPTECLVMFNAEDFERFALRMLKEGSDVRGAYVPSLPKGRRPTHNFRQLSTTKSQRSLRP